MNWNLVGTIYGRFSIEIAHFVLIHSQTWLPQAILVLDWLISQNLLLWNCFAKMNQNLVGSTYGRFCIKFPQSRMKGERHDTGSAHWASSSVLYYLSDNTTVSMRVTIKEMFFNFKFLLEVQMYFFHVHFNTNLFFPFK